jgi:hypothetical protein
LGEFDLGLTDAHRSNGRDRGHAKPPHMIVGAKQHRVREKRCARRT